MTRLCDNCNKEYNADERNIKRCAMTLFLR
jgi:hypothetical protein